MKKLIYLFVPLMIASLMVSCSKDQVDPLDASLKVAGGGNIDCSYFLPCTFDFTSGNLDYVEGVNEGSYEDINWSYDPIDGVVTWWSDLFVNVAFIVKGGTASNYFWEGCGECSQGGEVYLPTNPVNGKKYGLSHIAICYSLCEQPEPIYIAVKSFYTAGPDYDILPNVYAYATSTGEYGSYPYSESEEWCANLGTIEYLSGTMTVPILRQPDDSEPPVREDIGTITVEPAGTDAIKVTIALKAGGTLFHSYVYVGTEDLDGIGSCPVYTGWANQDHSISSTHVFNSISY